MNVPILAHDTRCAESNVGQGNERELSRELSSSRPESWRAKLLGVAFAALILASVILLSLLSSGTGEAANAGGDGVLLYPAGNLTRVAANHVGRTIYCCDTLGADKTKTHGLLIAGKHLAYSTKGAG